MKYRSESMEATEYQELAYFTCLRWVNATTTWMWYVGIIISFGAGQAGRQAIRKGWMGLGRRSWSRRSRSLQHQLTTPLCHQTQCACVPPVLRSCVFSCGRPSHSKMQKWIKWAQLPSTHSILIQDHKMHNSSSSSSYVIPAIQNAWPHPQGLLSEVDDDTILQYII